MGYRAMGLVYGIGQEGTELPAAVAVGVSIMAEGVGSPRWG